jgi:hypothetical protein
MALSAWTVAPTALALVTGQADASIHLERVGSDDASEPGFMRLSTRFAPERIVQHGRRCDDE